jgi:chromosome segregation ATPase
MKLTLSIAVLLMLVAVPQLARAGDPSASIEDQKEKMLEADHDTVVIRDIEAERKMAREQALVQEQVEKEASTRLEQVRQQRSNAVDQAKGEVAAYEQRRKNAEKSTKQYNDESAKLSAEIKKIEDQTAAALQKTKDAEGIMNAGKEEIRLMRERKAQLEPQNRAAITAETQADAQIGRLREEYARVTADLKDLEARLAQHEADTKRKQAMIGVGQSKVSGLIAKENQIKAQLGIPDRTAQSVVSTVTPAAAHQMPMPETVVEKPAPVKTTVAKAAIVAGAKGMMKDSVPSASKANMADGKDSSSACSDSSALGSCAAK